MLNKSRLIAFVATKNPARSRKFFEDRLGLKLVSEDPFAIVFDANGTMLRVQKVQRVNAAPYTALGWQVKNIRIVIARLTAKGVRFEKFDGMPQDELGIWESPAGAKVAWFKDPDGNMLSLTEFAVVEKPR